MYSNTFIVATYSGSQTFCGSDSNLSRPMLGYAHNAQLPISVPIIGTALYPSLDDAF